MAHIARSLAATALAVATMSARTADDVAAARPARPATAPAAGVRIHQDAGGTLAVSLPRYADRAGGFDVPARPAPMEVALVRLPDGAIALRDADGRPVERPVTGVWMARHETTWAQYNTFVYARDLTPEERAGLAAAAGRPRELRTEGRERGPLPREEDDVPVGCVTVAAARRYCEWLSAKTGRTFRLPTEAEWAYACRAGGPPVKPGAKLLGEVAWFSDNADDRVHRVGQKRPNAWGLYDMLGNVAEYVTRDGAAGLVAGGSWLDDAAEVHSEAREAENPDWLRHEPQQPPPRDWREYGPQKLGFRVVTEDGGATKK